MGSLPFRVGRRVRRRTTRSNGFVPKRNCWVKRRMPSLGRKVLSSAKQARATRRVEFYKTSWSQDISTGTSTGQTFMVNVPTSMALLFNGDDVAPTVQQIYH